MAGRGSRPIRRSGAPRRSVRRRRSLAVLALLVVLALIVWLASRGSTTRQPASSPHVTRALRPTKQRSPDRFAARRLPFVLPFALQDAAAVALGDGRLALLGGLDAADTSTATVTVLDAQGVLGGRARLPEAQHDAQGAFLGGRAYVFGGGQFSSYSHILSYDPEAASVAQVASLPSATSDAAVATIAGTAYVVGGYDGQQALDTIVAWRPGAAAHVVARLAYGLRYAAVAASGGRLLIAGGSRGQGATTAIMSFDPFTGHVRQLGNLPEPITHAAAVALAGYVYVLGGRGAAADAQDAAIFAIAPASGRTVRVGALPQPLSDAAAAVIDGRVWLAGGLSASGPLASVLQLTPLP